jgi:hypothetical protein
MIIISFLGVLSLYTDFDSEALFILAMFAFMTSALLMGFVVVKRFCKSRYRPTCILLWLGLWLPICCICAIIGLFGVGMIIMESTPPKEALLQIPIIGLFFGLFLYVVNLPFMILGFVSPFFRDRFYTCLNLKPVHSISEIDKIKSDNEQNPDS